MEGPEQALEHLQSLGFAPKTSVVIEGGPAVSGSGAPFVPASIRLSEAERIEVEIETDEAGYLVLTDTWFPGWLATVNGEAATIHRANHLFRAVSVEAGKSKVVFEYEPLAFRVGVWISGLTAAFLAMVALQPRIGTQRSS